MRPFFTSSETAERLERAECELLTECAESVSSSRPGVHVVRAAGGVAVYAGAGAPLNKIAGLGFTDLPTDAELDRFESLFFKQGERAQVELSTLANPELGAHLSKRGYTLAGFENVLVRPLTHNEEPTNTQIEVRPVDDLDAWLDTVVEGFMMPDTQGVAAPEAFDADALRRIIAETAGAPSMRRYIAMLNGTPAGGASLRIDGAVAHLCGAATLQQHRRQGVQTALLRARIAAAAQAGCELLVVTTLPGSKSQENVQRHGFEVSYSRAVLVREPA